VDKGDGVVEKESEKIMPRTHKPYDANFRQQAVELLSASGKTQRDVARDLGISADTLRDWKQQAEQKLAKVPAPTGTALDLERENRRLRQELAYTQRQREILKKALAICSEQPGLLGDSN
jgi:transposase-like protein